LASVAFVGEYRVVKEFTAVIKHLDQYAIKQFHKLDGMDREWGEEFVLNHAQMRFVQNATPGSDERGYSQAPLAVEDEWRGVKI
jgi:hypothetical protein